MSEQPLDDEVIEVARRLIAAPSENPPGDERLVAKVIEQLLNDRGIEQVETIRQRPERPNLIARLDSGTPGPTLVLAGHIDTKPAGELHAWDYDPFAGVIADGRLYGLGACDMKGGVASIIVTLGRLAQTLQRGSVIGVFTADEEAGSGLGAKFLAESGRLNADAAIITEPAGINQDWQGLYLGTRGSLLFRIDLEGAKGHSSLEDHFTGTSATMAMAQLMIDLDAEFRRLPGVAVNVGATVEGGMHYGVRAASASVRGDIRFPPDVERVEVQAILASAVTDFLAEADRDVSARIVLDELPVGPFDPLSVPSDCKIANACREAAEDILGHALVESTFPGGTDSFFLQGIAGIPTVPAFGPGCLREAHQPNEYVSLGSLCAAPRLLVSATERFLNTGR